MYPSQHPSLQAGSEAGRTGGHLCSAQSWAGPLPPCVPSRAKERRTRSTAPLSCRAFCPQARFIAQAAALSGSGAERDGRARAHDRLRSARLSEEPFPC